jgi:glutathione S-transferase
VQDLIWRYFENDIEGIGFKLNDIYWEEMVPPKDRLLFLRQKERKFGRGCIDRWREQQPALLDELEQKLVPCEEMLLTRGFLLDDQPRFVDFDLFGMLGNFLYSGHYKLPRAHTNLAAWHKRMSTIKAQKAAREKLHT